MAAKYIDTSLSTGANDGTSPADAWRSFIEVFDGTFTGLSGSVSAGDIIYVRTADGSGNLSESMSAAAACGISSTIGVSIVFDDGTIWPQAGVFTLDQGASYYAITFNGVPVYADGPNHRLRVTSTTSTTNSIGLIKTSGSTPFVDGLFVDFPNFIGYSVLSSAHGTFSHLRIDISYLRSGNTPLVTCAPYLHLTLNNLEFNCSGTQSSSTSYIIEQNSVGASLDLNGGTITGANISWENGPSLLNASQPGGRVHITGLRLPDPDMNPIKTYSIPALCSAVCFRGLYSTYDVRWEANPGSTYVDFKEGENFPYLNASLPNAANDGWSYRVTPGATGKNYVHQLPTIEKFYDQAAAVKTITVEFLVNQNFKSGSLAYTSLVGTFTTDEIVTGQTSGATAKIVSDNGTTLTIKDANGIFEAGETIQDQSGAYATNTNAFEGLHKGLLPININYVENGTGALKTVSQADFGVKLPTSSADWSNTSYGNKTYSKYKISLTTPTAVKQASVITVKISSMIEESAVDDFWFLDPDVGIT